MYNKTEKYQVVDVPGVGFEVRGFWRDDIHDLRTRMVLDVFSFAITEAQIEALQYPNQLCQQGFKNFAVLLGKEVGPGFAKFINDRIMGRDGFYHAGEMAINSIKAVIQAGSRQRPAWMDEDIYTSRWKEWMEKYKDICIWFAQPDISKGEIQECIAIQKKDIN
ncbi:MAG: DUF2889 domain-containing protein [Anaerolineaceae bacterium]